ncbi:MULTISPECIES: IPTL-CTERM sorting domain-containing protein [unclassified Acidovorax]|uniref:IPTL-CTERM sorting domain-containing protein n=1 Tax=unclassified Acidovorax TaxID=2684926 RepID=UPI001C44CEB7|nr:MULTISPECIES: IPTL-CTERM sorting domain-containing protein [unclassified Acidovorax]MBV7460162.1 IPTL-CTERM sorting domain-containing protein [Acidovorax sp. sif0632]MBV7465187.1 IPTL-CTERM sorting domain-containing protein [Acidovorax sp. sif0613]
MAFILLCVAAPQASALIIGEFRVRGPNGANDEFIKLYNETASPLAVVATGTGTGYGVAASDGTLRCSVPNGTVIPAHGHYLCVNSVAYSIGAYPAGNGTTATGDATYVTDIPDNAGIALFSSNTPAEFLLANRLDAVGSTSEANTLYKEGAGYPALTPFSIDYAFTRDICGKQGSITTFTACLTTGVALDTNNNAVDFYFVDTNGTSAGAGQRLGAPSPSNLSSPVIGSIVSPALLDPCVAPPTPPNSVRDLTSDPANNSTFGTLDVRRTFTNTSGGDLTRLRFKIIDLTTFPAPSGTADLRPRTSSSVVVTVDRAPCGAGTSNVTVEGTTLEQPPSQPNGGGFNSTLSAGAVTLGTPLAAGASIDVRFLLGIQQTGSYRFSVVIEGLPEGGGIFEVSGCTDGCPVVQSIVRADADPTAAASVDYTVTFSTPVTGVDAADFALTSTGTIAGASITGVSGAGAVYTVTVNTGTGNGTLRLDVTDDNSINAGGSPLGGAGVGDGNFTTGAFYTIARGVAPVSNIPTLSEYAMMLLGLALLGSVWLQRKRGNLR